MQPQHRKNAVYSEETETNNLKNMAVEHIPTQEVHKGYKGGKTACGVDTNEHATHWQNTYKTVTCRKNGCK